MTLPISDAGTLARTNTNPPLDTIATTQSFDGNIVLIGGIVGGVAAFLICVGLIAWLVARRRGEKSATTTEYSSNQESAPAAPLSSIYAKIGGGNDYDESFLKHAPKTDYSDGGILANSHYDIVPQSDPNYGNSNIVL